MAYDLPDLDPRDEDTVVTAVISDLPSEITDRNRSTPEVKLIEACGAFYGALTRQLNQVTEKITISVLNLLGIEQEPATSATVTLTFTTESGAAATTVPAGTIAKTGTGLDAIEFATDAAIIVTGTGGSTAVSATAVDIGADGNVSAGTIVYLDEPIAGIASVTNGAAAAGGQDQEALASMEARAPLAVRSLERAINDEDFATHAAGVAGIERAVAFGEVGAVTVHVLATDLNKTPSSVLRDAVKADAETRTIPGVVVVANQPQIRLVKLTQVEVKLSSGAASADVATAVAGAMAEMVTATAVYDSDGSTVLHDAWAWGEDLYLNEVVALIDRLGGVSRVGAITASYSDDYGGSWSAPAALTLIEAAAGGVVNDDYGMLHYDDTAAAPVIMEI